MENLFTSLHGTPAGEWFYTALMSMAPIVELRGGIPLGVGLGLPLWQAYIAAVIGNMVPVPFIIVFIRRVFKWLRANVPPLGNLIGKMEDKAHLKGRTVRKYKYLGLIILVAIPLPGTGAWTGALVAAFLDMRLRDAVPSIFAGVLIAGLAISALTHVVVNGFAAF